MKLKTDAEDRNVCFLENKKFELTRLKNEKRRKGKLEWKKRRKGGNNLDETARIFVESAPIKTP
jgi:hypothetical protein